MTKGHFFGNSSKFSYETARFHVNSAKLLGVKCGPPRLKQWGSVEKHAAAGRGTKVEFKVHAAFADPRPLPHLSHSFCVAALLCLSKFSNQTIRRTPHLG